MKDYLSAMLCLQLAIDKAGDKAEYNKIKERALLSLTSLKNQNLSSTNSATSDENEENEI